MDWGDIAGSQGFQIGYPILNALLAGSGQRGYHAAQGLNVGMGIANQYSEQRKKDEEKAQLSQKLGDMLKTTTPVSSTQNVASMPQIDPQTAEFSMPSPPDDNQRPSFAPVPMEKQTTITQKPMFNAGHQKLGEALVSANRPDLAVSLLSQALNKEAVQPHTFGSAETGFYSLGPGQENATQQVPGVGRRQPTPPRPVVNEYGTMIPTKDPTTGEYTWPEQPTAAQAPPARQLSPEQKALEGAKLTTEKARPGLIGALLLLSTPERLFLRDRLEQLEAD